MKRIFYILMLLLPVFSYADTQFKKFECSNSDVDSSEEICTVNIAYSFSSCSYGFTVGTAVLSDFDIAVSQTPDSSAITEYTASADYTTPTGFLYYASSDLTTANTSDPHLLVLDHLQSVHTLTFSAAGTSSVITGTVVCNDL